MGGKGERDSREHLCSVIFGGDIHRKAQPMTRPAYFHRTPLLKSQAVDALCQVETKKTKSIFSVGHHNVPQPKAKDPDLDGTFTVTHTIRPAIFPLGKPVLGISKPIQSKKFEPKSNMNAIPEDDEDEEDEVDEEPRRHSLENLPNSSGAVFKEDELLAEFRRTAVASKPRYSLPEYLPSERSSSKGCALKGAEKTSKKKSPRKQGAALATGTTVAERRLELLNELHTAEMNRRKTRRRKQQVKWCETLPEEQSHDLTSSKRISNGPITSTEVANVNTSALQCPVKHQDETAKDKITTKETEAPLLRRQRMPVTNLLATARDDSTSTQRENSMSTKREREEHQWNPKGSASSVQVEVDEESPRMMTSSIGGVLRASQGRLSLRAQDGLSLVDLIRLEKSKLGAKLLTDGGRVNEVTNSQ